MTLRYKKLAALAVFAALTGCNNGGGAGVSSGAESEQTQGQGGAIERAKSLLGGSTTTATVTAPGVVLATEVIQEACGQPNLEKLRMVGILLAWKRAELTLGFPKVKPEEFTSCGVANMARLASVPSAAWYEGPKWSDQAKFDEFWVRYANGYFSWLLEPLGQRVFADQQEVKNAIFERLQSIQFETYGRIYDESVSQWRNEGDSRTVDHTQGNVRRWTNNASAFEGGPAGITWTKSGVVMYGAGSVNGRKIEVGMAQQFGSTQTKVRKLIQENTNTDKSAQGAEIQVKP